MPALTIPEIKEDVLRRARVRQDHLERGAYDVPLDYSPLPLARLLDLLGQWEYRRDFLDLAVPPPAAGLGGRLKRFFKRWVCTSLRWLLIRQVECNTAALEHARASAELWAEADRQRGEVLAALTALKLQVHALARCLARSEGVPEGEPAREVPEGPDEKNDAYQVYLDYFRDMRSILVLGSGRGDFLKLLLSEGVRARGSEVDPVLAEYCRERELPVVCADSTECLDRSHDASLGGIFLGHRAGRVPPQDLARLLGRCWTRLKKGGVLIAEAANRHGSAATAADPEVPAEWLGFLFESEGFTLVDHVFSAPAGPTAAAVARTSAGRPFDRREYQTYALVGRK